MADYYVNKHAQSNGDHEVHIASCSFLPSKDHLQFLGNFSTCQGAVVAAKNYYAKSNGCYYCSRPCNTG